MSTVIMRSHPRLAGHWQADCPVAGRAQQGAAYDGDRVVRKRFVTQAISLLDAMVLSAANAASSALVAEIRRGCHDHAQHHPSAGVSVGCAD
jgi:hypothetical protein